MENPFEEVKDTTFLKWLWANWKTHIGLILLFSLIFIVGSFCILGGNSPYIVSTVVFLWALSASVILPFNEYRDAKQNYDAFEESINKPGDTSSEGVWHQINNKDVEYTKPWEGDTGIPEKSLYKRIILSGGAGSGKDYLRDIFHKRGFIVDVSYTTRNPRDGETPGYTYNFVGVDHFKQLDNRGKFYESVVFNKALYGTSKDSWENSDVFIMTPSGVEQISAEDRENCIVVYFKIEEDVRRERMGKRKDNGFDKIERRILADNEDFKGFLPEADMVITNPLYDSDIVIKDILDMAVLNKD